MTIYTVGLTHIPACVVTNVVKTSLGLFTKTSQIQLPTTHSTARSEELRAV